MNNKIQELMSYIMDMNHLIKSKEFRGILMMKWKIVRKVMDCMTMRKRNKEVRNVIDVELRDILREYVIRSKWFDVFIA
jgi:hypothetical protein